MSGYCVKCRCERDLTDVKSVTMKNGRPATEGKCSTCGTRVFRLGKQAQA